jgi:hypothetical protein
MGVGAKLLQTPCMHTQGLISYQRRMLFRSSDPHGPIRWKGRYHIFNQGQPISCQWWWGMRWVGRKFRRAQLPQALELWSGINGFSASGSTSQRQDRNWFLMSNFPWQSSCSIKLAYHRTAAACPASGKSTDSHKPCAETPVARWVSEVATDTCASRWEHYVSEDLVHWTRLPPALIPTPGQYMKELNYQELVQSRARSCSQRMTHNTRSHVHAGGLDADGCFTGNIVLHPSGVPMLFYTGDSTECCWAFDCMAADQK